MANFPALIKLKCKYKVCIIISYILTESQSYSPQFYLYVNEVHSIGALGAHGHGISVTILVLIQKMLTFLWVPSPNPLVPLPIII